MRQLLALVSLVTLGGCAREPASAAAPAAPLRVAVATSFAPTMQRLADAFRAKTGVAVELTSDSTAKLAAQVHKGAPIDLILGAENGPVHALDRVGKLAAGSRATYAYGPLALYGPGVDARDGAATLRRGGFQRLAVTKAALSAYGTAAREVLDDQGVLEAVQGKLIEADDEARTLQLVDDGAADLALLPFALVSQRNDGRAWLVPESVSAPQTHALGLVARKDAHPRAAELRAYLLSAEAQRLIEAAGYVRGAR